MKKILTLTLGLLLFSTVSFATPIEVFQEEINFRGFNGMETKEYVMETEKTKGEIKLLSPTSVIENEHYLCYRYDVTGLNGLCYYNFTFDTEELWYANYFIHRDFRDGGSKYTQEQLMVVVNKWIETQTRLYGEPEYFEAGSVVGLNEEFSYYKWIVDDTKVIIEIQKDGEWIRIGHEFMLKFEKRNLENLNK